MSAHSNESHSLKPLFLMFGATFFFGLVAGVIVFLGSNTGNEGDGALATPKGFVITAYTYGGCSRVGCPSYRLLQNGSYTYITRETGEGKNVGELSSTQIKSIRSQMDALDFQAIVDTTFEDVCPITYDGVAYRYEIEYDGERYTLDSCADTLDDPFFEGLAAYFDIFSPAPSQD